jgi:DNA polymerase I-like protein with 3'-5' exonuclease and polymerase domains
LSEAEELFEDYFNAFPKIKGTLDAFGNFGKMNGFIRTIAPFRRKRYFPYWKGEDTPKGLLGQIERASKNMPRMCGHLKLCENGER